MRNPVLALNSSSLRLREATVGEVCDQFGGEVQTGPFGSQLHASDYELNGTPVVMPQDLCDGRVTTARIARVGKEHVVRLRQHSLRAGDIVFSRRGDVARFAVITTQEEGWVCGTGCVRIRLNCAEIDVGYLRWYLSQASIGRWLEHNAKGVTMPNLNTTIVRALPLVYPPISEQRRIAAIFDQADALRAKRRESLALLDELQRGIFIEMFGDPAKNPKNWPKTTLDEISSKVTDGEHQTPLRVETGIKLLSARNVQDGYLDFRNVDYIDEQEYRRIAKRCNPQRGDILISCSGSIGRVAIVDTDEPLGLVRSAALVKPNTDVVESKFLEAYLRTPYMNQIMVKSSHSSSQANLFQGPIRALPVFVPPLAMQGLFVKRSVVVNRLRAAHFAASQSLDALFSSLQHRAFRGQL